MKIKTITRQTIYLSVVSLLLFVFVFVFSFLVLIPEGKMYRIQKSELKKENLELEKYQEFNNETLDRLKKLQSDNAHIITAFKTPFNAEQFEKLNKIYFNSLSISEKIKVDNEEEFSVYEVNTTSKINSPKVFYDFLDAINKSEWIIAVNFPINFKKEADMIRSSFTMKVYSNELNASQNKSSTHGSIASEDKSAPHEASAHDSHNSNATH
ncbi:MAG: hypothetical protein NTW78_01825 [Campylobacterales bacterium]|nr:hypothetical protein [Campylobacterales bacterium]